MVFLLSLFVEVIIVLNSDGFSTTVDSTSFLLVYLLGIYYLLLLLGGFPNSIKAYFIDLLGLIRILLA